MNTIKKVVLASGNAGKLAELHKLLEPLNIELVSQSELGVSSAIEDGLSFIENAIIKARHAAKETGLPALADDSGLDIDALDGRPGIYSARYAKDCPDHKENIEKVLSELKGIPKEQRTARFHCVIAFVRNATDPAPFIVHETWEGLITEDPQGEHGFGYDPILWIPEKQCTSAQLDKEVKNQISHRGKAIRALLKKIQALRLT